MPMSLIEENSKGIERLQYHVSILIDIELATQAGAGRLSSWAIGRY